MSIHDPEPDRDEAAQRPSPGWDAVKTTASLLNSLDAAIESLPGCKDGLHDFDNESTGPWAWSTTRVECSQCGQKAIVAYDAPPDAAPERDRTDHELLLTTDQIAAALLDGSLGSDRLVKIRSLPASLLWMALRKALDRINADGDPDAWLDADEQHREWAVRQHSDEGVLLEPSGKSRRQSEEKITSFENWHDPDGRNPRPDFRLELVWREVGPWRTA